MSEQQTASDVLVDRLIEWGVDTIFGLPGDGINGFMDALRKRHDAIQYIHMRHEEVGAMAAVGYAKFTGKLGVCFATAAPGAAMPADAGTRFKRNVAGHTSTTYRPPIRVPRRQDLEAAASVLAGKTKVAILAGAGARGAGEELEVVADTLGAPVIKAMLGKDCIPDDSPYSTGGIALVGTRPSEEALEQCDALLIVGSTMPYIEFYPSPGQAVCVQIDDKPDRIGLRYPVDVPLAGDAKATLAELAPLLPRNEDRSFLTQAQQG